MTRLMVVDDDRELSELLAGQLTRAGFVVRFADSLQGARAVAAEEAAFDVLITDLHLPDGDGAQIARELAIPIKLALTGSSSPADTRRLLEAGFSAVLVKPLTGKQVAAEVTRCLGDAK